MGEKGLSGTAGDDAFDDDAIEAAPEPAAPEDDARVWMPEREPAYAADEATPAAADVHDDAPGVAYGG